MRLIRITPAHAGKSKSTDKSRRRKRDHPRACGEKPIPRIEAPFFAGITPAHAGKSTKSRNQRFKVRDHPRACGEKWAISVITTGSIGSPPRMRGKDTQQANGTTNNGITPAHAGKSITAYLNCSRNGDHPRACGEKQSVIVKVCETSGSPPRMRGKDRFRGVYHLQSGITPAHAGKREHQ